MLIVEIPVRHGKSQFLSQYTTAWYLGHHPTHQVILASATQRLAERWSRRARQVVADYGPAYYGVGLSGTRTSAQDWQTDRGGGLVAAGIGSDIVGVDGNLLVLDDYCRNARDALSETVRDAQWEWFESTFMRRWEPGGVLIVLCTRWSTDDLIGRAMSLESFPPYRRIRLPAIAEDADDELGRKPGEALWPERWPLGSEKQLVANAWGMQTQGLHMTRASIDEYWWRALYQQDPRAGMMAFWPEEYWRGIFCDSMPTTGHQAACIGVDFAEGKSAGSDYAAVVLSVVAGDKIHVRAELQREPPEATIARAFRMACEHKCTFVVMEAQNYTTLIAGACEREMAKQEAYGIDVELIRNTAQKHYRIQRLGEYFKRRQIRILNTVGGRMLERQLAEFPHARHDDGCFVAGTLIATDFGPVPIEDIRPGDHVLTRAGYSEVLDAGCTGFKEVITLVCDGVELTGTPGHPIWSGDGFVPMRSAGIMYICPENIPQRSQWLSSSMASRFAATPTRSSEVIGLTTARTQGTGAMESGRFTRNYGSPCMVTFQQEWKFTTRTETQKTTPLITSRAYHRLSTETYTERRTQRDLEALRPWPFSTQFAHWLRRGTDRQRELSGTALMVLGHGKTERSQRSPARIVASHSIRTSHTGPSSAHQNADSDLTPQTVDMRAVRVTERRSAGQALVFNLTVAGSHEYFANGVLVHNCDALEMSIRFLPDAVRGTTQQQMRITV